MARPKFQVNLFHSREAEFSEDRQYRNWLKIVWNDQLPIAAFVGLNPSLADEVCDDPTVRRCRGYAEEWNCGGIIMLNLFAIRATDPRVMRAHHAPIGGGNTISHLKRRLSECAGPHIACWGRHGSFMGRGRAVLEALPDLCCLALNDDGSPAHPLYLRKGLHPIPIALESSQ